MEHDIFRYIKRVKLSSEEKERGRSALRAFIATNPVREGVFSRLISQKRQRSIVERLFIHPMPIALIIALILGGGVTFAAEQSLPGEALYPVKINVNEQVRSLLAVSDDAEARLQANLAERRLEEAEKLAVDGRLNDDVLAKIESNFDGHAARVATRIEAMKNTPNDNANAVAVGSRFEASLRAHEEILNRLAEEKKEEGSHIAPIVAKVRDASDDIDLIRVEAETNVAATADTNVETSLKERAARKQREAEQKIKDVRAFMEKNPSATVAPYVEVKEKLKLAEKLLESGKQYMELKAYGKAFITFQESWNVAQKAWIVLTGSAAIRISVGSVVSPSVVTSTQPMPVPLPFPLPTPGNEESKIRSIAEQRITGAARKITEVRNLIQMRMAVMTEKVAIEVDAKLKAADKAIVEAKQYFELGAYSKAIVMANEAKELAEEAYRIATGETLSPSVLPSGGAIQIQKITPSGEIEDAGGSGKFR